MKPGRILERGYTLVELLVAMSIGLILVGAVIAAYVTQTQTYNATSSVAGTQSAENAIAALVTPIVRATGFFGCLTNTQPIPNLNAGGSPPLQTLGTAPTLVYGYDASGTAGTGTITLTQNAVNDTTMTDWTSFAGTSGLDASLSGQVEAGSDVLVMLGAAPGSEPASLVNPVTSGATSLTVVQSATSPVPFAVGQLVAVSDCSKTDVFPISTVAASGANTTLTLAAASGNPLATPVAGIYNAFAASSQLVPLQQTALYVAQGAGGQSVLTLAKYVNTGGTWGWQFLPLVPGVDTMQVLYGTGNPGTGAPSQYIPASAVTVAESIYSVRLAFLLEGQPGSASASNPTSFTLLGTTVNVPTDTRQRRVYEMTINLRNAS